MGDALARAEKIEVVTETLHHRWQLPLVRLDESSRSTVARAGDAASVLSGGDL